MEGEENERDDVFGEVISQYTIEDAERDGVLCDISKTFRDGLVSHVTTNLLSRGYIREDNEELNIPNMVDLLNQSLLEMRRQSPDDVVREFYAFKVEFPDGGRREVYTQLNERGRMTLMLPEDY